LSTLRFVPNEKAEALEKKVMKEEMQQIEDHSEESSRYGDEKDQEMPLCGRQGLL